MLAARSRGRMLQAGLRIAWPLSGCAILPRPAPLCDLTSTLQVQPDEGDNSSAVEKYGFVGCQVRVSDEPSSDPVPLSLPFA
jgi:hypothetical protein